MLPVHDNLNRLLAVVALWCGLLPAASVRAEQIDESKSLKVKAAYLYNFAKFIHWPVDALGKQETVFVVCVLDDDPFTQSLNRTVRGKSVANRAVKIRRMSWAANQDRAGFSECRILYVGRSIRRRLGAILALVAEQPVLVVSDIRDFAREGGMIGFVLEQGRIVFEINRGALEHVRLKASAKLMRLARIVETRVTAYGR